MRKMKKLSDEFVISVGLLLVSFFIFQAGILPTLPARNLGANARLAVSKNYSIKSSEKVPGAFIFDYVFPSSESPRSGKYFDAAISEFNESAAKKSSGVRAGSDFGLIRDAWGYPIRENSYHTMSKGKAVAREWKTGTRTVRGGGVLKSDNDPNNPGIVNCRANTNVSGYFQAFFEDVALDTNAGYDDPTYGQGRQDEACQVLQDISILIKLDQTNVTPDILFQANPNIPPNALAAASAYFGYYSAGEDNGSLHKHIISRTDPTPAQGSFDAMVLTNFNGVPWDTDSTLNPGTYDLYTVLYHEVMHTLGFRGLLPSVIGSTGDEHLHGTFDFFSYKNDTLANRFFNGITHLLNVPVGAPSSWFITNTAVYRGVKNIVGVLPDGIRPIFSPSVWQQGSSLSHFDMNRANGEVYVMHPSLPTNTVRPVHDHEKEVLCHLGYEVLGLAGCDVPSPFANNDVRLLMSGILCLQPMDNDTTPLNEALSIHSFVTNSIEPGDTITYYPMLGCGGAALPNASGAKSFTFAPSLSPDVREMSYSVKGSISNRISNMASIYIAGCNGGDPDEHVCNGSFEMDPIGQNGPLSCGAVWNPIQYVPFWCSWVGTPDLLEYSDSVFIWMNGEPFECDGCVNGGSRFIDIVHTSSQYYDSTERALTELKAPLVPGESYRLSFDVFVKAGEYSSPYNGQIINFDPDTITSTELHFELNQGSPLNGVYPITLQLDEPLLSQTIPFNVAPNTLLHFEHVFTASAAYDFLGMYGGFTGTGAQVLTFNLDNVSIKKIPEGTNTIKGKVYEDADGDGMMDAGEFGLAGIEVGLFEAGDPSPFATVTTSDVPNLGEYEFMSVPDGTSHAALVDENIFSSISEPALNTGVIPGYDRVISVPLLGGQTDTDNDFGVMLGDGVIEPVPVDLKVTKELLDSTLSLVDRNITWRVRVANIGNNNATGISISDVIPAGLIYVSHTTQNPQESYDPLTGAYVIPTLPVGSQTSINIVMKVPQNACGNKINIASLIGLDQVDSITANNSSSAAIKLKPCLARAVK